MTRGSTLALGVLVSALGCTPSVPETTLGLVPTPTPISTLVGTLEPPVLVGAWGGRGTEPGQFIEPSSVELDSDGTVIVAGHEDRVQRFTPEGDFLDLFGVGGAGDGDRDGTFVAEWTQIGGASMLKPTGVYVDSLDRVYVCDSIAQRVGVFDTEGESLEVWELSEIVGRATEPEDIVVNETTGHVYIGEVLEHTVLHLAPSEF